MSDLLLTVGLEIHAELRTTTKMFCTSANNPDEDHPNVNICPICLAHPGTLPTINHDAVLQVLRVGKALGGTLADYTEFDRKNYFYPDLPKGYQISQYEHPLVSGGALSGVQITRIHLEEDTARSQHDPKSGKTLVDYNRAGVPLMELVTEPVIHSAEQAGNFARELQLVLRYLGAGNANLEKGEMRVEANISVAPAWQRGTKVEVKNLNSFRSVERAIEYEYKRQSALIENGGVVHQETLGWDEGGQKTYPQRVKEGSADYRYFPDPDLPKLVLSLVDAFSVEELQKSLPILPWERRERYRALSIAADDAELYVRDRGLGEFFDQVLACGAWTDTETIRLASNYVATDLVKLLRDFGGTGMESQQKTTISPEKFAALIEMLRSKTVSSRGAKDTLAIMAAHGGDPRAIAEKEGLIQSSNAEDLVPVVQQVIKENAAIVQEIKAGKSQGLQFLIGQGMKAAKQKKIGANPQALQELFRKEIS